MPVLTDAVEEIEAAAPVAAVDEGEPSDWLDFETGEPSVIGDAPDSIAIVPPLDLRRPEHPTDIDEFDGLDEELAAAVAAAPREEEPLQPASPPRVPVESPSDAVVDAPIIAPAIIAGGAAALLHDASIPAPRVPASATPDNFASTPSPPVAFSPAIAPVTEPVTEEADAVSDAPAIAPTIAPTVPLDAEPVTAEAAAVPDASAGAPTIAPTVPLDAEPVTAPTIAPFVAPGAALSDAPATALVTPAAAPVVVDDSAHWEAMAEEIRMQVLQRIDLFTDTGLRAQLGERLQPIVDRASADLVATINSHVGEILRAYVAEAIEREIENWRRNH